MQGKLISCVIMVLLLMVPLQVSANQDRSIIRAKDLDHTSGKIGTFRALIIGIQNYNDPKIPDLETPLHDARAIADVLKNKYGFKTETILEKKATKKAIYNALRKLASSSKPEDSVLIYYAGHGDLDRQYDDGWWIPVDARGGDPVTYLDNGQVQKAMRSMKARHVLLVSDSCYSGSLFGQARAMPSVITDKYYLNLYNEKSRWGMTSGNKTPVSDSGTAGHSVFAYQLIKKLKKNEKPYITTQEIYTDIAPIIGNNSDQTPLCRPIRSTGDMGGEFIFVATKTAKITPEQITNSTPAPSITRTSQSEDAIFWQSIKDSNVPAFFQAYLKKFPNGTFADLANLKLDMLSNVSKKQPDKGWLDINTQPQGCTIKILNIKPRYRDGIELDQGEYRIQVSKSGYTTKKKTAQITSGEGLDLYVELKKKVSFAANPNPGDTWTDPITGMEFVWVQKGCFQMGSNPQMGPKHLFDDDEKPTHEVCLDGFWIGKYEVTQEQWRLVMGSNPSKFRSGNNNPVEMVSWEDTKKFIRKLNQKSGKIFSLPTEAQWEYAARSGGKNKMYAGSNGIDRSAWYGIDRVAWYDENSGGKTHQAGTKAPNGLGIYDMSGNVWEWCEDMYDANAYSKHSRNNPVSTSGSSYRVIRGGSWFHHWAQCRVANREAGFYPSSRLSYLGLRLVLLSGH